jgi:hypothetical protein
MRRFAEGAAAFDRGEQVSQPQDRGSGGLRAWLIDFHGRADLKPLHKAFEIMVNDNPAMAQQGDQEWLDLGLCERNPALAERALAIAGDGFAENGLHFSYNFNKACVARTFGHDDIARSAFIAARGEVERAVREQPGYGPPLCMLGLIDAGLGRKEEAIREGRRAAELTPVTKDGITGSVIMKYLGVIYAWTGEKDLAIKQIAETLQVPGDFSYGELRLHPIWDPLRGDPRFEKLVEEAKKPIASK